jgi:hypothetical protein
MKEISPKSRRRLNPSDETMCAGKKAPAIGMILLRTALAVAFLWLGGCSALSSAINVGKWKGIERTGKDEEYYLAKNIFLTAGSAFNQRTAFDHNMHESINVFFTPRNETNTYTLKTVWYDPAGQEFRTIRATYDRQREVAKGEERSPSGTTRVQTISTKELYDHKPGSWKVAVYLDGQLVRRLNFTVR